jgi:exosortase
MMVKSGPTATIAATRTPGLGRLDAWVPIAGFLALAIPTGFSLAAQEWNRDSGAHGPIVLAIGGWLIWRQWGALKETASAGSWPIMIGLLLLSLPVYMFGRAYDFLTLEAGGLYGAGLAVLQSRFGLVALRKIWFPLLYLAFAIPAPHSLMDSLTAPLKEFVSHIATSGLAALGMPVARQGVTIFVAQYQLLVEDACSGMNSLIGLTAISLLYVYLARGPSILYSLVLTCLAIPVAIAANVIRVALLVIVTYLFGDEVGQSFIHFAAGILLFLTALLLVFALDKGLQSLASLSVIRRRPT